VAAEPSPGRSSAPLAIEPVIGWRTWSIGWNGDGVYLASPMQEYDWQPMQPNRARCRSHFGRQLPNLGCGCGFYAVSHLQGLPVAVASSFSIGAVGSVAMWGRVVEHTAGYRGQLAYPDRIRLVCGRCFVARLDGVPTGIEHVDGRVVPICDAHANGGRMSVEGMTPAELEQEVLSAYAVDVLPLETLHRAGFQAGPVPPTGVIPNARAELRELRRSRSGVAALVSLVAALLIVRALGLFPSTGPGERPDSAGVTTPIAADEPFPGSLDAWRPLGRLDPVVEWRHHVFGFGLVCADRIGDHAILMACWRPRAELLGAYSWPPEPRGTCTFGNAYSRRPGFSVCWLDVEEGLGPRPELLRLPGVRRWDLAT
jgi:hypothetical protein